jgi:hypothetical protein
MIREVAFPTKLSVMKLKVKYGKWWRGLGVVKMENAWKMVRFLPLHLSQTFIFFIFETQPKLNLIVFKSKFNGYYERYPLLNPPRRARKFFY